MRRKCRTLLAASPQGHRGISKWLAIGVVPHNAGQVGVVGLQNTVADRWMRPAIAHVRHAVEQPENDRERLSCDPWNINGKTRFDKARSGHLKVILSFRYALEQKPPVFR